MNQKYIYPISWTKNNNPKETVEFVFKNINLKLRKDTFDIMIKFKSKSKEYTQESDRKYKKCNKAIAEFIKSLSEEQKYLQIDEETKQEKWFADVDKLNDEQKNRFDNLNEELANCKDELNEDLSLAIQSIVLDADFMKEVLSKCLDGDLSKIDYKCENDNSYMALLTLGTKVLQDFFLILDLQKSK